MSFASSCFPACTGPTSLPRPIPIWLRALPLRVIFSLRPPLTVIRIGLCGRDGTRELAREVHRAVHTLEARLIASRVRAVIDSNCATQLAAYTGPLLCLIGGRDRIVRRRSLSKICAIRTDVKVQEMDAPHLILQTHPSEAWRAIERFIADLD